MLFWIIGGLLQTQHDGLKCNNICNSEQVFKGNVPSRYLGCKNQIDEDKAAGIFDIARHKQRVDQVLMHGQINHWQGYKKGGTV
jgi:hypothetical protein